MQWYPRHLGDYYRDANDLTTLQHGIYTRLLDECYAKEGPVPVGELMRVVTSGRGLPRGGGAQAFRKDLDVVLSRYFELREDGWHQKRADKEIQRFKDAQLGREAKRGNERSRKQRHNDDRSALFRALREAGLIPDFNARMHELRKLAQQLGLDPALWARNPKKPIPDSRVVVQKLGPSLNGNGSSGGIEMAHEAAIGSQFTQHEDVQEQEMGTTIKPVTNNQFRHVGDLPVEADSAPVTERAARVQDLMETHGIPNSKAQDPALIDLLEHGALLRDFEVIAAQAKTQGKSWQWVLYRTQYRVEMRARRPDEPR